MPNVNGVVETSLYVEDLDRAIRFYESLFGFDKLIADQRFCAFGVAGQQVLLLFKKGASLRPGVMAGGTIPPHDGSGQLHLAFAIAEADWEPWLKKLGDSGVPVESVVHWERGGRSLYFRDPDRHLVELITPGCWSIY
jgi:catechol 2,3-dioxygenase-like lactoylglutathione lyase family enzyme